MSKPRQSKVMESVINQAEVTATGAGGQAPTVTVDMNNEDNTNRNCAASHPDAVKENESKNVKKFSKSVSNAFKEMLKSLLDTANQLEQCCSNAFNSLPDFKFSTSISSHSCKKTWC
jgi:hypothetical protein